MGYDIPSDHHGGLPQVSNATNLEEELRQRDAVRGLSPTEKCNDIPLLDFVKNGWTREALLSHGYAKATVPKVQQTPGPAAQPAEARAKPDPRWDGSLPRIVTATTALLRELDPEPNRSGLAETPMRVAKAWQFWTSGYRLDPADVLKEFEDGAQQCDEMVVRKHVPIYSHCEHHMAPIIGEAVIAYIPSGRIVGLSKLDRLADIFARRLQVQERMTNQIAEALWQHLSPQGCGVVVKARHMCMESRGVCHQNSETITSALRGCFRDDARVRAEFLSLAYNGEK